MNIEVMKLALEALETPIHVQPFGLKQKAMSALNAAIAEAEKQEPVAWEDVLGAIARGWTHPENAQKPMDVQLAVAIAKEIQDMYTTPPAAQPAQRQPLTEDQIDDIWNRHCDEMGEASINDAYDIARAIEAAHGITGGKT